MEEIAEDVRRKPWPSRCYLLMFITLCTTIVGLYFIIQAYKDPQTRELKELGGVISVWDKYLPEYNSTEITIYSKDFDSGPMNQNSTETWTKNLKDFPKYTPLFFSYLSQVNKPVSSMNAIYNSSEVFNVTTNVQFTFSSNNSESEIEIKDLPLHMRQISPVNEKVCRNTGKGYWNKTAQKCYVQIDIVAVCLVVNNELKLESWYLEGCDGKSYLSTNTLVWKTDAKFTELNQSVYFQIRSTNDPFVYASYNSLTVLSETSVSYAITGITFVVISFLFIILMIIFWVIQKRKSRYLKMERNIA